MSLAQNLLAGLANSLWTAVVTLAVVPLYLKYLGIEAYGLIGFFATMQALLQILDFGLAPTINREVARVSASGKLQVAGNLLRTLAVIYWGTAGLIAVLIVSLAPSIAMYWLQSKQLPQDTVTHAVMLMGLVVACRWPIGLYQGALMGAQRLTVSSGINMAMVTLGNFGAVGILAFVSSTIQAFFAWQVAIGLVHAATMRWAAWRAVGQPVDIRFDVKELKRIWRFSAGMYGIAISALVITQLDKVVLSKILALEEFGRYVVATVLVSGLYVLITPIFNVIYPRFTALVVNGDTDKLKDIYQLGTRALASLLFPIAMVLAVCAEDLVRVWTGNPDIARSVAPVLALLAMGTALHGVMHFPYALQLAYGMTGLPLTINAILTVVSVPLIVVLAMSFGALGGAMAWLTLHALYLTVGTWLTHRRLLKGIGRKWLYQDVGIPLGWSVLLGVIGVHIIQGAGYSAHINFIYWAASALLAFLLSIAGSRSLRLLLTNSVEWTKVKQ